MLIKMIFRKLKISVALLPLACLIFWLSLSVQTASAADEAKLTAGSGLTVLITGANRGLGLEFATQFRARGYTVIGTARSPEKAVELKATGARVMKLDVTSEEEIADLAKALGGERIDILINNAGYIGSIPLGSENLPNITNITRQDMTDCFNVNTLGPVFVTQALLPNLKLSKAPKIINVSSRAGALYKGATSLWSYSVSKTALNMATVNMHGNLHKQGFIVIALAPGHNKTDMGTERAKLYPEDSIGKIIPLIENLTPQQSGGFWYYDGSRLDW